MNKIDRNDTKPRFFDVKSNFLNRFITKEKKYFSPFPAQNKVNLQSRLKTATRPLKIFDNNFLPIAMCDWCWWLQTSLFSFIFRKRISLKYLIFVQFFLKENEFRNLAFHGSPGNVFYETCQTNLLKIAVCFCRELDQDLPTLAINFFY